jgi:hypothetical protein
MLTTLQLACLRACLLAFLLLSSATEIRADDAYRGQGLAPTGNFQPVQGLSFRLSLRVCWCLAIALRHNSSGRSYGVENLDFTQDSAPDFTLATVLTYRFGQM